MNPSTSLRSFRAAKPVVLVAAMLALALPQAAHAQGNSPNTPAADHRQNEDHPNNGNSNGVAPVPEPATWAAMASLVALGALFARRHFKQAGTNAA